MLKAVMRGVGVLAGVLCLAAGGAFLLSVYTPERPLWTGPVTLRLADAQLLRARNAVTLAGKQVSQLEQQVQQLLTEEGVMQQVDQVERARAGAYGVGGDRGR
jgi:hypothetical protein